MKEEKKKKKKKKERRVKILKTGIRLSKKKKNWHLAVLQVIQRHDNVLTAGSHAEVSGLV
jgi:hypothetical protein